MINIWAYREGAWSKWQREWHHVFGFKTLQDILAELKNRRVAKGQVCKMVIVAHGDDGGLVQLEEKRNLTSQSAKQFAKEFRSLRAYLSDHARLIFGSCIAGRGNKGSELLNILSSTYFANIHVIAFEKYGVIQKQGFKNVPGQLWCNESPQFTNPACDPLPQRNPVTGVKSKAKQILNEHSIYAKWSYNGRIIKLPYNEVRRKKSLTPTVICGRKTVMQALNKPQRRKLLKYVAMQRLAKFNDLYTKLQAAPYKLLFADRGRPGQLCLRTSEELRKLANGKPHGGIVALFRPGTEFKCADPKCPSHEDYWDWCEKYVKHIPNGPGKPMK